MQDDVCNGDDITDQTGIDVDEPDSQSDFESKAEPTQYACVDRILLMDLLTGRYIWPRWIVHCDELKQRFYSIQRALMVC